MNYLSFYKYCEFRYLLIEGYHLRKTSLQPDFGTGSREEPQGKSLVDKELTSKIKSLAELVPQLQDLMWVGKRIFAKASPILREASDCLQYLAKSGLIPVLPLGLYMVNENGNRDMVTTDMAERIRQRWSGDFLLDLPRQTFRIRKGKRLFRLRLGTEGLHWGVQQVLIVGMSQPGVPFGFHTFSRCDPKGSGIGTVKTLTRYICEARRAIGDTGLKKHYIHKTRVDPNESPSRWGYVFDNQWSYLVIATPTEKVINKSLKSIEQSIDGYNLVNT